MEKILAYALASMFPAWFTGAEPPAVAEVELPPPAKVEWVEPPEGGRPPRAVIRDAEQFEKMNSFDPFGY